MKIYQLFQLVFGGCHLNQVQMMREAPAIYLIRELSEKGATIKAYDPKATEEANFI